MSHTTVKARLKTSVLLQDFIGACALVTMLYVGLLLPGFV